MPNTIDQLIELLQQRRYLLSLNNPNMDEIVYTLSRNSATGILKEKFTLVRLQETSTVYFIRKYLLFIKPKCLLCTLMDTEKRKVRRSHVTYTCLKRTQHGQDEIYFEYLYLGLEVLLERLKEMVNFTSLFNVRLIPGDGAGDRDVSTSSLLLAAGTNQTGNRHKSFGIKVLPF